MPLAWHLPALVSLAVLSVLLIVLNAVESIRFRAMRDEIRHGGHEGEPAA